MALDFIQIDETGHPAQCVPIGIDLYADLFGKISKKSYPLLGRMYDYYEDVLFLAEELESLKEELARYLSEISKDSCQELLKSMLFLVEDTLAKKMIIEVIAD